MRPHAQNLNAPAGENQKKKNWNSFERKKALDFLDLNAYLNS